MGKRISKRVREEAAFICAIRASNPDLGTFDIADMWAEPLTDEYVTTDDEAAVALAFDAWEEAACEDFRTNHEHWAAAERLLIEGWTP